MWLKMELFFWFPGFTRVEKVLQLPLAFWFRVFAYLTDTSFGRRAKKNATVCTKLMKSLGTQFLTLATILICLSGCKDKPKTNAPPPPTVEVTTVTQSDVPI